MMDVRHYGSELINQNHLKYNLDVILISTRKMLEISRRNSWKAVYEFNRVKKHLKYHIHP